MELLVIAVIIVVIAAIGALVAYKKVSTDKKSSKAPFKKTYSTGMTKKPSDEPEAATKEISSEQPDIQSVEVIEEVEDISAKGSKTSKNSSSDQDDSAALQDVAPAKPEPEPVSLAPSTTSATGASGTVSGPLKADARGASTEEKKPSEKEQSLQVAAEITEVEIDPLQNDQEKPDSKQSAQFITEIESEPAGKTDLREKQAKETPAPSTKKSENKKAAPKTKAKADNTGADTKKTAAKPAVKPVNAKTEEPETQSPPANPLLDQEKTAQPVRPDLNHKVEDLLSNGKLDDWIAFEKESLTFENYQAIVYKITKFTYPKRKDPKIRAVFMTHAQDYVDKFKPTNLADVPSEYIFKCLAIVLQEDKRFLKAINLCKKAVDLGLADGTKTGYKGRIERLKKAQKTAK